MPLINGSKYSCEPCIRGHRATSCNHTDRVLVEVRKPGRPLQSCGHKLATCSCGRLADAFSVGGDALDQTASQDCAIPIHVNAKSMSTNSTIESRPRAPVAGTVRVTKRRASKTASPPTSQIGSASLREAPIELEEEKGYVAAQNSWQSFLQQEMTTFTLKPPKISSTSSNFVYEHTVAPPAALLPSITPLLHATGLELQGDRGNVQAKSGKQLQSLQQQTTKSPPRVYASRVEDVSIIPDGDFSHRQGESYIRSHYITSAAGKPHNWQT